MVRHKAMAGTRSVMSRATMSSSAFTGGRSSPTGVLTSTSVRHSRFAVEGVPDPHRSAAGPALTSGREIPQTDDVVGLAVAGAATALPAREAVEPDDVGPHHPRERG